MDGIGDTRKVIGGFGEQDGDCYVCGDRDEPVIPTREAHQWVIEGVTLTADAGLYAIIRSQGCRPVLQRLREITTEPQRIGHISTVGLNAQIGALLDALTQQLNRSLEGGSDVS